MDGERTVVARLHTSIFDSATMACGGDIEILMCQNQKMLESAQRLRYSVYCKELQRRSPYADHDQQILADDMDKTGHTFIAVKKGETIGTARVNLCSEGSVGVLEELYGMRTSTNQQSLRNLLLTERTVAALHR
jgi:Acetyltransferase (GNAT) domain